MIAIIAVLAFVVVALAAFVAFSLIDERRSKARLLRERLATVEKAAERQPSPELALLRDEMLSEIPAISAVYLEANNRTWDTIAESGETLGVYTDARPPYGCLGLSLRR